MDKMNNNKRIISCTVDKEFAERIDAYAHKNRMTKSQFVRMVMDIGLQQKMNSPEIAVILVQLAADVQKTKDAYNSDAADKLNQTLASLVKILNEGGKNL